MIDLFLPPRVDNAYRGHRLALWLFGAVIVLKLAISAGSMFNGYEAASSSDGIPLDTYSPAAAQAVVSLFALLGLLHLVICVVCIVVLVRYRALVPLMFALLIAEYAGRKLVLWILPIAGRTMAPGLAINLAILGVMVVGLVLSLRPRSAAPASP
jgi:hypothetical protein